MLTQTLSSLKTTAPTKKSSWGTHWLLQGSSSHASCFWSAVSSATSSVKFEQFNLWSNPHRPIMFCHDMCRWWQHTSSSYHVLCVCYCTIVCCPQEHPANQAIPDSKRTLGSSIVSMSWSPLNCERRERSVHPRFRRCFLSFDGGESNSSLKYCWKTW